MKLRRSPVGPGSLALLLLVALPASAEKSPTLTWTDSARDVWVDGQLDRAAQVLSCREPRRIALVSPLLQRAAVIDLAASSVSAAPKDAFHFSADRAKATTEADLLLEPLCKCSLVDPSTFLLSLDGKSVLIARHQGAVGELSREKLFETVPVWRSLLETYEPSAAAVAALAKDEAGADLTIVFGTWCGDSKSHVPKLLKALEAAHNPKLTTKLVGLASRTMEPIQVLQDRRITNVPTVIVERGGKEIGRIVETPSGAVEEDLVAILAGNPPKEERHFEHGRQLASGTYVTRDAKGREIRREAWELYERKDEGLLLHSSITGDGDVEVYQGLNEKRQPGFVEVTKRTGGNLSRARFIGGGDTLESLIRGSDSGVMEQTVGIPKDALLISPAGASLGLCLSPVKGSSSLTAYVVSSSADQPLGLLRALRCDVHGEEEAAVPAGRFTGTHLSLSGEAAAARELWLHRELGIPVRAVLADGSELVLASLELTKTAE